MPHLFKCPLQAKKLLPNALYLVEEFAQVRRWLASIAHGAIDLHSWHGQHSTLPLIESLILWR
jgi:hypothetical protein